TGLGAPTLWDASTGARLGAFPLSGDSRIATFSPDGSTVAFGGLETVVRVFDTDTRAEQLVLRGHTCGVSRVAFSADGSMLAANGCDGARIWSLDVDTLLEVARDNVTRSLTKEECRRYFDDQGCSA
ncbi:MAG TPA: WD40 repeat domain-containing protein, partial [Actinomycetota bacterium]